MISIFLSDLGKCVSANPRSTAFFSPGLTPQRKNIFEFPLHFELKSVIKHHTVCMASILKRAIENNL